MPAGTKNVHRTQGACISSMSSLEVVRMAYILTLFTEVMESNLPYSGD